MTDLTTIIVSYNTKADLLACLASLKAHPFSGSHEIIVVDNASADGSLDAVRQAHPDVRAIDAGGNLGFAAANNIGITAASGELCLLLNSDTLVPEGTLDGLVAEIRRHGDVAAVGPRIVDGHGRTELSFGRMMSPWNELRQKLLVRLHDRPGNPVASYVERIAARPSFPDWITGACILVWREDAIAAGLLDEGYFLYAEDVDFCAALRALGKRIRFYPGVWITHLRGRSGSQRPQATERHYRRSQVRFYEKHHPAWAGLLKAYLRARGRWPVA
jgi:GT2 family glycosyltransferase